MASRPELIREEDVLRMTAVSHATLWRRRARGEFPEPQKVGTRSIGWLATEVAAWLDARSPKGSAA